MPKKIQNSKYFNNYKFLKLFFLYILIFIYCFTSQLRKFEKNTGNREF